MLAACKNAVVFDIADFGVLPRIYLSVNSVTICSTELTIYATEKSIVGGSHRLSARNLFVYLQANQVSFVLGELGRCVLSSSP